MSRHEPLDDAADIEADAWDDLAERLADEEAPSTPEPSIADLLDSHTQGWG